MRVQPLFDEPPLLVRDAALDALVEEVERAIERHANPHDPSFDYGVEVAGEWLQDEVAHARRQLRFELRRR